MCCAGRRPEGREEALGGSGVGAKASAGAGVVESRGSAAGAAVLVDADAVCAGSSGADRGESLMASSVRGEQKGENTAVHTGTRSSRERREEPH